MVILDLLINSKMKILKSWLQNHIIETLPSDESIIEALTLKSSEVEGVERVGDYTVFDLKVLPDRAHYMLSHRGVAYDLCAILGLNDKNGEIFNMDVSKESFVKVTSNLCVRYSALRISNIQNTVSPDWLKKNLEAIGARSISTLVDATNYAMFDTGQPLHAFDADKVVGDIVVRLALEGEVIQVLSGDEVKLKSHQLVIADDQGPLAIAGVKGGKRAEVTLDTKNIVLEAANFNPVSVRKTSFEVSIRNDSSKRFENEITPELTIKGISVFLEVLNKSNVKYSIDGYNDIYPNIQKEWNVTVSHLNIESILNYKIAKERVIEILNKLNCKADEENGVYTVTPPPERLDIVIPEDVIDEIGRINGLDMVQGIVPNLKTNNVFSQEYLLIERIKDYFVEKGFSEIQTRSFTSKGDIEVSYPMASDKGYLRRDLRENMTKAIELSVKNAPLLGLDVIKIFEIGKVFPKTGEQLDICFGIQYVKKIKNKDQVIKVELENIIKELEGILNTKLNVSYVSNIANVEKVDRLSTDLKLDSIKIQKGSRVQFSPFSQFPFITRDIAIFVDPSVTEMDVKETIIKSLQSTLVVKGPDIFDSFEKDSKKSLAYRMIFQASDRTLTDAEVASVMDQVYSAVKARGWEVR
jgi:phenylalanyl-tRNA synthetase beta chain